LFASSHSSIEQVTWHEFALPDRTCNCAPAIVRHSVVTYTRDKDPGSLGLLDKGLEMTDTRPQPSTATVIDREPSSPVVIHPAVDVRSVLFTLAGNQLLTAVTNSEGRPGLPRDLPTLGESLDATARRIIHATSQHPEHYLEQLYTLSVLEFEKQWAIIVSYIALISTDRAPEDSGDISWHEVGSLTGLSETDRMVIDYAVLRLRAKLGYTNIAFHLLPVDFTLTELQRAYETILGQRLDKRNFRRRMIASGILTQTEEKRRDGSHRPAALYRFRAEDDTATYLTPPWTESADGASTL